MGSDAVNTVVCCGTCKSARNLKHCYYSVLAAEINDADTLESTLKSAEIKFINVAAL